MCCVPCVASYEAREACTWDLGFLGGLAAVVVPSRAARFRCVGGWSLGVSFCTVAGDVFFLCFVEGCGRVRALFVRLSAGSSAWNPDSSGGTHVGGPKVTFLLEFFVLARVIGADEAACWRIYCRRNHPPDLLLVSGRVGASRVPLVGAAAGGGCCSASGVGGGFTAAGSRCGSALGAGGGLGWSSLCTG